MNAAVNVAIIIKIKKKKSERRKHESRGRNAQVFQCDLYEQNMPFVRLSQKGT